MSKFNFKYFCFCFILSVSTALAESPLDQNVNLGSQIFTVKEWLISLREKGHKIFFVHNQIDSDRLIRLNRESGTIGSLLKDILRGQPLDIVEKEDKIFIVRKKSIPIDPDLVKEKKMLSGIQQLYLYNPNAPF